MNALETEIRIDLAKLESLVNTLLEDQEIVTKFPDETQTLQNFLKNKAPMAEAIKAVQKMQQA